MKRANLKPHLRDHKGWFLRRCFTQRIAKEEMDKAFRLSLEHDTQQNKNDNGAPLVITYRPAIRNLSTAVRKNFNVLYSDAEVRTVFTPCPFLAYKAP